MTRSCWKSFWPKYARSGVAIASSFATTVATPVKWPRRALQPRGDRAWHDVRVVAGRIDLFRHGDERRGRAVRLEEGKVRILVARIGREVLTRTELGRIDEDRRERKIVLAARAVDER